MRIQLPQRLPLSIKEALLDQASERNMALKRRMTLIHLMWVESRLEKAALMARTEAILGVGCFGSQAALTFARDIKFVREVFLRAGYTLRYRRKKNIAGYDLLERPNLESRIETKIMAAIQEVSSDQAAIQASLSPAERVWQGAHLSDQLVQQAIRLKLRANPDLDVGGAQREVLQRMYQLEA